MRLIDADKLMEELDNIVYTRKGKTADRHMLQIVSAIQTAPTVDAVEAVRKPIKEYDGRYEVDQFGRVFSVDRIVAVKDGERVYNKPIKGRQMKQSLHTQGYKTVSLTKDGETKTLFVHRLVAQAFLDNSDNLPFVNHKDEDRTNNFVENLEWCTVSYNNTYNNAHKKRAKKLVGIPHTEEHKRKISQSMKKHFAEIRHGEREDD